MTHKLTTLALAGMLAMPATAQAQEMIGFSGTATVGYSMSDLGGIPVGADLSTFSFDAETDVTIGDNVKIGFDFGYAATDVDIGILPIGIDTDLIDFSFEPAYHANNGAYVGMYYEINDLDVSIALLPIALGVDTQSYGIFGGYQGNRLWVEGFAGVSDTDPGLPLGIDVNDFGLAASYELSPRADVFGSILYSDIGAGGIDLGLTAWSGGGEYEFFSGLSGYGSLGFLDIDLGPAGSFDAFGLTLGVAYDLAGIAQIPAILSAEYSHTEVDLSSVIGTDPTIDRFSVAVTLPLGGGSGKILNSNTRTARGEYRSAITALVSSF